MSKEQDKSFQDTAAKTGIQISVITFYCVVLNQDCDIKLILDDKIEEILINIDFVAYRKL